MIAEKNFTLIILAVSITATIATGSLAFLLQQQIVAIDAKKTGAGRELTDAVANWQEAQRHIDLAVHPEGQCSLGGNPEVKKHVLTSRTPVHSNAKQCFQRIESHDRTDQQVV
jgi:hypothetical protein